MISFGSSYYFVVDLRLVLIYFVVLWNFSFIFVDGFSVLVSVVAQYFEFG